MGVRNKDQEKRVEADLWHDDSLPLYLLCSSSLLSSLLSLACLLRYFLLSHWTYDPLSFSSPSNIPNLIPALPPPPRSHPFNSARSSSVHHLHTPSHHRQQRRLTTNGRHGNTNNNGISPSTSRSPPPESPSSDRVQTHALPRLGCPRRQQPSSLHYRKNYYLPRSHRDFSHHLHRWVENSIALTYSPNLRLSRLPILTNRNSRNIVHGTWSACATPPMEPRPWTNWASKFLYVSPLALPLIISFTYVYHSPSHGGARFPSWIPSSIVKLIWTIIYLFACKTGLAVWRRRRTTTAHHPRLAPPRR